MSLIVGQFFCAHLAKIYVFPLLGDLEAKKDIGENVSVMKTLH